MSGKQCVIAAATLLLSWLVGCTVATPTICPTPEPTATCPACATCEPTATVTTTKTPRHTNTPTESPTATATATPQPTATDTPRPEGGRKPVTPGLYWFGNHSNIDAGAQQTGSSLVLTWRQAEPVRGQIDYARIDAWANVERAHGHQWILRIDVHQNRGAISLPAYVPRLTLTLSDGRKTEAPDYRNPVFQASLVDFIRRLGAMYDADPDLTMVQIGLGLYGEAHPERNDTEGQLASQLYDGKLLTACEWIAYQKTIIDAYVEAFPTTQLVIMNAPTYPYPCRETVPPYSQTWARPAIDAYAISRGVGAQNNSLDEWDANWFTCVVTGTTGPYTVDGAVGPYVDAGLMIAGERGSWLRPFPVGWQSSDYLTWWSYLNGISKGMKVIFPPQYAGKVLALAGGHYIDYPTGVWDYDGPYADDLRWMNDFALRSLRGELRWWAAFDAPAGEYWGCTAQHTDHEYGVRRLTPMRSAWDQANARPPFYESKYMRVLDGPVTFATEPGRYRVTVWWRGAVTILGRTLVSADWKRETFTADVPAEFTVDGSGNLHAIILE